MRSHRTLQIKRCLVLKLSDGGRNMLHGPCFAAFSDALYLAEGPQAVLCGDADALQVVKRVREDE
jgi:hypothetical protein